MICSNCESEVPDHSKFCLNCGFDLRADGPRPDAIAPEIEESEESGEYRYLTVMFIDLVGSTRLSEKLSAEAYRRLVLRYRQICVGPLRQFGGYVAKYLGDGILVYFGYPNSYEDNAARACHAAIEIHKVFGERAGEAFRDSGIRIGIHSGRVLISSIDDGRIHSALAEVGLSKLVEDRGGLDAEGVERFDARLGALLKERFPEPFGIPHRLWVLIARRAV